MYKIPTNKKLKQLELELNDKKKEIDLNKEMIDLNKLRRKNARKRRNKNE